MPPDISVQPDTVWTDPEIHGLTVADEEWQLDVDLYCDFILNVAGIAPRNGLTSTDCYRIGNRLQARIEEYKRNGEWEPTLVETHRDIESLEEFLWLARVFRACHDQHDPDEPCYDTGSEDCCAPAE